MVFEAACDQRDVIGKQRRGERVADAAGHPAPVETEAERLAIAWGMWRAARDMLRNLLHAEHPEWPESAIQREAARRLAHYQEGGSEKPCGTLPASF